MYSFQCSSSRVRLWGIQEDTVMVEADMTGQFTDKHG